MSLAPSRDQENKLPVTDEELRTAAREWLLDDPDDRSRIELQASLDADDVESLREGFSHRLEFGTAGLRGVLGPGPGRMNRKLVRQVTRGVADALLARDPDVARRGIVVGADARRLSPEMADDTTRVFAGAGIRVHRFSSPAATPVIAWLQRHLDAAAAVIVTASHNPPEYNGYKVYADGAAQIIPPLDREISVAIDRVVEIPMPTDSDLVTEIDEALLDHYYTEVMAQRRHPGIDGSTLRIVATPLHGVGGRYLRELFTRAGYTGLELVPAQAEPDGEFPTVQFPNPEEPGALDLALEQAARTDADLILANDPDADRLAVAIPDAGATGGWYALTGNEIGCLLAHWLLTEARSPITDPLLMTTIVSSRMLERMAPALGAHYAETLTGFKWIAHRAREYRERHGWSLVLGYEEALGYTVGETVADKDGISAALVFAEMAVVLKQRRTTLRQALDGLYREYGLHRSLQHSLVHSGPDGARRIEAIMDHLRSGPPMAIAGVDVVGHLDWAAGIDGLPSSNVLGYELGDGGRILVRPSGTEPKIKFYLETMIEVDEHDGDLDHLRVRADAELSRLLESILQLSDSGER
jgi:phosphomannomutase